MKQESSKLMITIIGAGPAGIYSAYLLSKNNFKVNVFDRKKTIGLPVQCTGIVTSKIREIIELNEGVIRNRIRKVEVNSSKNTATINLKEADIILDREKFDCFLAEKAESAGAKIFLEKRFIGKENDDVLIKDLKKSTVEKIKADYVIGADGPISAIYNILNPGIKREYYKGIQIRAKGVFDKDTYKVYLGSSCPDFFAWVVPEDEETARVGLASMRNPKDLLKKFLQRLEIKKAADIQAGLIPIYNPKIKTQKDNLFLVGDAAGQLKASTGGGILQGLIAANALADSITKKKNYEDEWKKKISKDLWLHLKIRQYLNKFRDEDYDILVGMLKNEKLRNILETESRDNPSRFLIKMIAAEPRLIGFVGRILF